MITNKFVKDYLGNLVPKAKARKILGKYYVEGESCFLMPDDQWYRITSSEKIAYDNYTKKYVLKETTKLIEGFINSKGDKGFFTENMDAVILRSSRSHNAGRALSEGIANDLGYTESVSDGVFYQTSSLTDEDKKNWFNKKNIPAEERSKSYNVESDPEKKNSLQGNYDNLKVKVSAQSKLLAKYLGDYSIGAEFEVINGFIPARIRNKYGFKNLKDGSLRSNEGEGIEYASSVMKGVKCIQTLKEMCTEFSRRCELNNFCSLHFHFGNVRRDKLYVLSLYRLISVIQTEMLKYFPYSRFNSIKDDGKIYCKPLPDLSINWESFLKVSDEEIFKSRVVGEFNKIYKWLNNGKGLAETFGEPTIQHDVKTIGGKKMFATSWLRNIYTTKAIHNAVEGQKWDKTVRYHNVNFLNLFFTKLETVEFRCMEGTFNFTKAVIWLLTCASILKYAENIKECLSEPVITLEQVLLDNLGKDMTDYFMAYYTMRNNTFFTGTSYKSDYKGVEAAWFKKDAEFKFKHNNIQIA